jgi:hypothetical protein
VRCDDVADCGGELVCCAAHTAGSDINSYCMPAASCATMGGVRLCAQQRECPSGQACCTSALLPGYGECR